MNGVKNEVEDVNKECGCPSSTCTSKERRSGIKKSYLFFDKTSEIQKQVELNGAHRYDFFFLKAKKEAEAAGEPWVFNETITKTLTKCNCNSSSRLLIPKQDALTHIYEHLDDDMKAKVKSPEGLPLNMLNWDDGVLAEVTFKVWGSSDGYVLNYHWRKDFVQTGKFGHKDQVGLRWDDVHKRLLIKLLSKADDQPAEKDGSEGKGANSSSTEQCRCRTEAKVT